MGGPRIQCQVPPVLDFNFHSGFWFLDFDLLSSFVDAPRQNAHNKVGTGISR
jgi:hypothetical protein